MAFTIGRFDPRTDAREFARQNFPVLKDFPEWNARTLVAEFRRLRQIIEHDDRYPGNKRDALARYDELIRVFSGLASVPWSLRRQLAADQRDLAPKLFEVADACRHDETRCGYYINETLGCLVAAELLEGSAS